MGNILRLYGDKGKEPRNYYNIFGLFGDKGKEDKPNNMAIRGCGRRVCLLVFEGAWESGSP